MFRVCMPWNCLIIRNRKKMENTDPNNLDREPNDSLLLSYIKGTATASEKASVEAWIAENAENEKTVRQLGKIYFAQRTHERIASRDPQMAFEKVQKRINGKMRRIWVQRFVVAAACLVSVVFLLKITTRTQQPLQQQQAQLITVEANPGMRTHIHLPDGTMAYLNSGSTLTYTIPFDVKERKVALKGEAYFKVSHNPEQPFVVSVADDKMNIKVLGTEFNVQAYNDDDLIQTTLVSGAIDLHYKNSNGEIVGRSVKPSEKVVYDSHSGNVSVKTVNTDYDTAWMQGRLVFKETPLPEVLKKMTHYYNVTFSVVDPVIQTYNFTGTFDNRQLSQVLDYLKISSGIDYDINQSNQDDSEGVNRTRIILRKRK